MCADAIIFNYILKMQTKHVKLVNIKPFLYGLFLLCAILSNYVDENGYFAPVVSFFYFESDRVYFKMSDGAFLHKKRILIINREITVINMQFFYCSFHYFSNV